MAIMLDNFARATAVRESSDEPGGHALMAVPGKWDEGEFPEMEFDGVIFLEHGWDEW